MKKILLVSAILAALVGCSSDSVEPTADELTHLLLNGTWLSDCLENASTSFKKQYTFNDGVGEEVISTYANATCIGTATAGMVTFTYTFGDDVTLDGSVASITAAQQINLTFDGSGEEQFNIFAIKDLITFYLGAEDGATPETRPTQLIDIPHAIQL